MGSGARAMLSNSAIFFTTSCGSVMSRHVVSSLIMERSVGSVLVFSIPPVVRSRDLRAEFGRLTNSL